MAVFTTLNDVQKDVVGEIANIGAGHAATVLSQLTATPVMIDVPQVRLSALADVIPGLAGPEGHLVSVSMRMMGDLTGDTVFVLDVAAARRLTATLLHRDADTVDLTDAMAQSGLREVGNIMVSAFFNALGTCLGMLLMPTVPTLLTGTPAELTAQKVFHAMHEPVLVVETAFVRRNDAPGRDVMGGVLLFMPDADSLAAMMRALPRAFGR